MTGLADPAAAASTPAGAPPSEGPGHAGIALRLRLQRPGFSLAADLDLPAQGITVLFGASGSGKTTLLRCVAGLEPQARGLVRVGGETWQSDDPPLRRPTHQRPIGYVFQEASLFEHLDVRGNLQFGLQRARVPDGPARLQEAVALLGIEALLGRAVDTLSGGERQRVAIARALALQPRLLLLDEPLSALDAARRQEVMPWLERLRDGLRIPMLYVTHAVDEVTRLGEHLVLMERGQVAASGALDALLADPRTPAVEGLEPGVRLEGRVAERDARWQLARVDCDGLSLWVRDGGHPPGTPVRLRVLARDVDLATAEPQGSAVDNLLRAHIAALAPAAHPSQCLVRLMCGPQTLLARISASARESLALAPGQAVWVQVRGVTVLG